jgi:hypothetical protein
MAHGVGKYARSKHIALRILWVAEVIRTGLVKIHWISTKEMWADVLTKCLAKPQFRLCEDSITGMPFVLVDYGRGRVPALKSGAAVQKSGGADESKQ